MHQDIIDGSHSTGPSVDSILQHIDCFLGHNGQGPLAGSTSIPTPGIDFL
jgi:hypothetical protein